MAGILANEVSAGAVQQTDQVDPGGVAEEEGSPVDPVSGDKSTPTPQEQEAFSRVELAAKAMIHKDKKTFDGIVSMLKAEPDNPAKALATAAMNANAKTSAPRAFLSAISPGLTVNT